MDLGNYKELATFLTIAHDLICSGLLFVIVIFMVNAHNANSRRLDNINHNLLRLRGMRTGTED